MLNHRPASETWTSGTLVLTGRLPVSVVKGGGAVLPMALGNSLGWGTASENPQTVCASSSTCPLPLRSRPPTAPISHPPWVELRSCSPTRTVISAAPRAQLIRNAKGVWHFEILGIRSGPANVSGRISLLQGWVQLIASWNVFEVSKRWNVRCVFCRDGWRQDESNTARRLNPMSHHPLPQPHPGTAGRSLSWMRLRDGYLCAHLSVLGGNHRQDNPDAGHP